MPQTKHRNLPEVVKTTSKPKKEDHEKTPDYRRKGSFNELRGSSGGITEGDAKITEKAHSSINTDESNEYPLTDLKE